jgi:hypothetical protein
MIGASGPFKKSMGTNQEALGLGPRKKIIIHIAPDFGSPAGLKKVRILVVCKSFFTIRQADQKTSKMDDYFFPRPLL